jgi:hypothetical protein
VPQIRPRKGRGKAKARLGSEMAFSPKGMACGRGELDSIKLPVLERGCSIDEFAGLRCSAQQPSDALYGRVQSSSRSGRK